jgi:hypothetical protein
MTILLLVALVVWAVYLALRVRQLEHAVAALTRTVDKPQKRDRAIRKEIKELEDRLAFIGGRQWSREPEGRRGSRRDPREARAETAGARRQSRRKSTSAHGYPSGVHRGANMSSQAGGRTT